MLPGVVQERPARYDQCETSEPPSRLKTKELFWCLSLFDSRTYTKESILYGSGAEFLLLHRNYGQFGHFYPYIWEWVDTVTLYIEGRQSLSQLLIIRFKVRILGGS
jgi:hypothetical protein